MPYGCLFDVSALKKGQNLLSRQASCKKWTDFLFPAQTQPDDGTEMSGRSDQIQKAAPRNPPPPAVSIQATASIAATVSIMERGTGFLTTPQLFPASGCPSVLSLSSSVPALLSLVPLVPGDGVQGE